MVAKDETRWVQNADGSWSRRSSENGTPAGYDEPDATAGALVAAAELGIDLNTVVGTGADGKITKADVTNAAKGE